MSIVRNAAAIAKGMSITFREMFQPTEVENYPDGKGPLRGAVFQERFRGAHVLQRDENGLEKCVACFLCAAACPSNCIYIEADENTAEKRISSSERYAKVYNIDYNRCIFCGYCVEACPTDAITHGHGFELASLNATNLVMRKEDMLVPGWACRAWPPTPIPRSSAFIAASVWLTDGMMSRLPGPFPSENGRSNERQAPPGRCGFRVGRKLFRIRELIEEHIPCR